MIQCGNWLRLYPGASSSGATVSSSSSARASSAVGGSGSSNADTGALAAEEVPAKAQLGAAEPTRPAVISTVAAAAAQRRIIMTITVRHQPG